MHSGRHVVSNLHAHLVFVTKYRRGAFTGPMPVRCEQIMREVCAGFEVELGEFNGEDGHVRLLVHHPPKVALAKLVNSLTEVSARMLRKEFGAHVREHLQSDHSWSGSYFAGPVGGAPPAVLKQYIEQQKRPA
ncbi:IS200/IS605 family transposase [Sphaerisporangium sp. NPDC051017]|uniref:IS200/IS605 family transposase n=1 Tax=Sphaerisporangium sp. NPDC051017 TaxID=3154636 RepID=UPI0034215745